MTSRYDDNLILTGFFTVDRIERIYGKLERDEIYSCIIETIKDLKVGGNITPPEWLTWKSKR